MSLFDVIMEGYSTEKEPINEILIGEDSKSSAIVFVDIDPGRNFGDPYFKFLPNRNINFKSAARISFKEPKYIVHYSRQYVLNSNDKKALIRILSSPYRKDDSISNWVAAIREFNRIIIDDIKAKNSDKYLLPEDLPIPDYKKLK